MGAAMNLPAVSSRPAQTGLVIPAVIADAGERASYDSCRPRSAGTIYDVRPFITDDAHVVGDRQAQMESRMRGDRAMSCNTGTSFPMSPRSGGV